MFLISLGSALNSFGPCTQKLFSRMVLILVEHMCCFTAFVSMQSLPLLPLSLVCILFVDKFGASQLFVLVSIDVI